MLRSLVYGVIGGVNGAACMTVLRLAVRRAGWIEKAPPQAVLDWSAWKAGFGAPGDAAGRHVADQVVHLAIGALGGAGYGVLARVTNGSPVSHGVVFGLAFWALGFFVVMPVLGITRPPWRSRATENIVNMASHLVYGAATGLVADELDRQPRRATAPWWRAVRTG